MSHKLPVNDLKRVEDISEFDESFISFIKSYNEESDKRYFLEVHIQQPENLHKNQNDLPFLHDRMKIEKVKKLVSNLHEKTEYVTHIRNLKPALNHGLVLKKVHRVIKFNQNAWLKLHIDVNTNLRKAAKQQKMTLRKTFSR